MYSSYCFRSEHRLSLGRWFPHTHTHSSILCLSNSQRSLLSKHWKFPVRQLCVHSWSWTQLTFVVNCLTLLYQAALSTSLCTYWVFHKVLIWSEIRWSWTFHRMLKQNASMMCSKFPQFCNFVSEFGNRRGEGFFLHRTVRQDRLKLFFWVGLGHVFAQITSTQWRGKILSKANTSATGPAGYCSTFT